MRLADVFAQPARHNSVVIAVRRVSTNELPDLSESGRRFKNKTHRAGRCNMRTFLL